MSRKYTPKPFKIGGVQVRILRGPKPNDPSQWYWRAHVYVDRKQHTVFSGWCTKENVRREVAAWVAKGDLEISTAKATTVKTVQDLLETWLAAQMARIDLSEHSHRNNQNRARYLASIIGSVSLARLDLTTLEEYRNQRLRMGAAGTTLNKELVTLKAAWGWGQQLDLCPGRALPRLKVKEEPVRNKYTPTQDEVLRVLECLEGWPRVTYRLLYATGARIGEIARLQWRDFDLVGNRVFFREGKQGAKTVHIHPQVSRWLATLQQGEPTDFIHPVGPRTIEAQFSQRWLKRACKAAVVPRFSPNGLRRAATDTYARAGVDPAVAAAQSGHSVQVMMKHYRQVTTEDQRVAVERASLGVIPDGKVIALGKKGE
jgi:integrase